MEDERSKQIAALTADNSSVRLQATLGLGTKPDLALLDTLVERCGIEPDFFVRDMLTWALTRFPKEIVIPKLLVELHSTSAQARSQALHTLSKIHDLSTWPFITKSMLHDPDDEVARSAWRAAVILVPEDQKAELAEELGIQFGRGNWDVQRSLSRALVALGEEVLEPVLKKAMESGKAEVQAHASETKRLLEDSNADFGASLREAKRIFALTNRK